jgi:hypothetical protein
MAYEERPWRVQPIARPKCPTCGAPWEPECSYCGRKPARRPLPLPMPLPSNGRRILQ